MILHQFHHSLRIAVFALALFSSFASLTGDTPLTTASSGPAAQANSGVVTINFTSGHPLNTFTPSFALGGGLDGHERGELAEMLTPANVRAMLSAGLKPLSYRLRTELAGEAWHWNPAGRWSDPSRRQGYWISDSQTRAPISFSHGYRLPRRGNTTDQANNDDYSRIDDGNPSTFWKSNPYLDQHFTGESNLLHPQWIVIDLGTEKKINAIRIQWGNPFASRFEVQYARFEDISDISLNPPGMWRHFPKGMVTNKSGQDSSIRLSEAPITTRWVRVLFAESARAATRPAKDVRESLGYAVREISVGELDQSGQFHDEIHHAADHKRQTLVYVSSTDSWHGPGDIDWRTEQAGFDRVYQSGLTNKLPMLTPAAVLYDTPENAAAAIRYLKASRIPVERVELGEEPDGQYVTPEDYGALYLQFVDAMRKVDPALKFGGPSFQEIIPPDDPGPFDQGNSVWLKRFLDYLRSRDRLNEFSFFSFEWYPFDDVCDSIPPQLLSAPQMMRSALEQMELDGLSRHIPWIITEYGYSAFATQAEVDIPGALLNAEIVGEFLALGGDQTYLYGYEPNYVIRETDCTAGNNMLFMMGADGAAKPTSSYWAARLLTESWAQPADEKLEMYPVSLEGMNRLTTPLVTAYALRRPDNSWSLLLINKDSQRDWAVKLRIRDATTGKLALMRGPADVYQFSRAQYAWHADGERGYPSRSEPPAHRVIRDAAKEVVLPAYSLTVVSETGQRDNIVRKGVLEK